MQTFVRTALTEKLSRPFFELTAPLAREEPVDAADVHEGAVVGDTSHGPSEHLAFGERGDGPFSPRFRLATGWALSKPTSRSSSGPCSVSE